jgi:hypothetical protein
MKDKLKVTQLDFNKLLTLYVRRMSKHHHLPREIENQLLCQVRENSKS